MNLTVVTRHVGVGIADFLRPIIFGVVEAEIEARGLRPALPRRSHAAPAKK